MRLLVKNILRVFIFLFAIFEVPIFLIIKRKEIFQNTIVFPFWTWSFGHTLSGIDFVMRLYYPRRLTLIYVPHPRSNIYAAKVFSEHADFLFLKGLLSFNRHAFCAVYYYVLRFYLLMIQALTNETDTSLIVASFRNAYKTLSLAGGGLMTGDEDRSILYPVNDYTGYVDLLNRNIGARPKLPKADYDECKNSITKVHPSFFERPFVTILLRKKGGDDFSDYMRSSGSHTNYIDAVKYVLSKGYNVVGTGETDHCVFSNLEGYFDFKDIDINPQLLNIFLLSNCKLFIGNQSGPHILPNSCDNLCLICDALPYRIGTFNKNDIILYKHLISKDSKRPISYVEVFKNHKDLALGRYFKKNNIDIVPNTSEEILAGTKQAIQMINGELELSKKDELLQEKFRALPSKEMTLKVHQNCPPIEMLRNLEKELIG